MRRLLALALLLLLGACAKKGDPVRELIDASVADAEARDADALAARLTQDFRAADGEDRAAMAQTIQRLLFAYERLDVDVTDVTIERAPQVAQVAFRASLSGAPRGGGLEAILPRSGSWRFELRVVEEEGTWKIAQASWRPLEGGL